MENVVSVFSSPSTSSQKVAAARAAEDIHLPHVYVDRVIQGHSYEKRIEVREIFQQK